MTAPTPAPTTRPSIYARQGAFVRALSARGDLVRIIDAKNQSAGGPVNWGSGTSDLPYAVALAYPNGRFRTIALDFDSKAGGPEAAAEHAGRAYELLTCAGIYAVMAASGPSGGRHVLFTVQGAGLAADLARKFVERLQAIGLSTLDISGMSNPRAGAIRPPLSPHRTSGRSFVLGDEDAALEVLDPDGAYASHPALVSALVDALRGPSDYQSALRVRATGDANPGARPLKDYASGSEKLQAHATKIVNEGGTLDEFVDFVRGLPADDPVSAHLAKRPERCNVAVHRAYKVAVSFVAEHPALATSRLPDQDVLADWRSFPLDSLPGAAGSVIPTVFELADAHNRRLIGLSTREAAECSGVSEPTARRALNWAVTNGLLEAADPGRAGRAARYRLMPSGCWTAEVRDAVGPSLALGGVRNPTASSTAPVVALACDRKAEVWDIRGLGGHVRKMT
jgi:hypothetical protein